MTKYILNSGNIAITKDKKEKFNDEIFKDFLGSKKKVKVLFCFFAIARESWEEKYNLYFENLKKNIELDIEVDLAFPDNFEKQCEKSDVVFISGGDDELLQYRLSEFDIPKIWENKVIAATSASSDFLAESFWTCDWRKVMEGRGILPIKFIPHYKSDYGENDIRGPIDWQKAKKELENFGDKALPVCALEEGDFVVFEK